MDFLFTYWILHGLVFDMIGAVLIVSGLRRIPRLFPSKSDFGYIESQKLIKKVDQCSEILDGMVADVNTKKENFIVASREYDYWFRKLAKHQIKQYETLQIESNTKQHDKALDYAVPGLMFLITGFCLQFIGILLLYQPRNY